MKLIFCLTLLFSLISHATTPPAWLPFQVHSSNKRYLAKVSKVATYDQIKNNTWTLEIFKNNERQWKQPLEYNGFQTGLLTNDGNYFIFIEENYDPESILVWIYSNEHIRRIPGKKFNIAESKIKMGETMSQWLANKNKYRLKGNDALLINTVDGNTHVVDLITGIISK